MKDRAGFRRVATVSGMRALSDNRFLGRFRLRVWRRALIVVIGMFWALILTGWVAPAGAIPEWLWRGTAIPFLAAVVVLVLATRNLTSSVDAFADERDRAVRDRMHRLGYWTLGLPLGALLGLAYSFFRHGSEEGVVTLGATEVTVLSAAAWTVVILYGLTPTLILGWTEPDPPLDEEDV